MLIQNFEDSTAWQESQALALIVYQSFKNCKDFSFKDQIQRAVISISNNIAEGFERQTNKELVHFLYIAKGSCGEVKSMNYLSKKLEYVKLKDFEIIYQQTSVISKMIGAFIRSCK